TFAGNRRVDATPDAFRGPKPREDQAEVFRNNLSSRPAVSAERFNPPFALGASPVSRPISSTLNPAPQNLFSPLPGAFNPSLVPTAPAVPAAPVVLVAPGLPGLSPPEPPVQNKWMKPQPTPDFPRRQM